MRVVNGADFAGSLKTLSTGHGATHVGPAGLAVTPANMRQEPLPRTHPKYVREHSGVLEGSDAVRFCLKHGISMANVEGKIVHYFDPETAETTVMVF